MLMISLAEGRRARASRLIRDARVAMSLLVKDDEDDEDVFVSEDVAVDPLSTTPDSSCTSSEIEGGIAALGVELLLVAVANSEEAKDEPDVRRPDASHLGGLYRRKGTTCAIAIGEHTSARLSVSDADLAVERADTYI
jgi:hypothetical protein